MSKLRTTAAIDIGSNSLTMKIAEARRHGEIRNLETLRGALSLGSSSYIEGEISETQIKILIRQLQGFLELLKLYEIEAEDCPIVASSALREARNREFVVETIRQATGFRVRILSNEEERLMQLLALRSNFENFEALAQEGLTVLDIGAGSLQVSSFRDGQCYNTQNFLLGCLRISELFSQFALRARDYESMIDEHISTELLDSNVANPQALKQKHLLALGVDLIQIHKLRKDPKPKDYFIEAAEFQAIYESIRHLSPLEITEQKGIPEEVSEIFLAAVLIVKQYLDASGAAGVTIPDTHICDALIHENLRYRSRTAVNRGAEQDLLAMARHLAQRFQGDRAHSDFVAEFSLSVFRSLRQRYQLPRRFGLMLELLAILHDIGKSISLTDHAENSAYIVGRSEFLGFRPGEKEMLLEMIRRHSGTRMPASHWGEEFSEEERRWIISAVSIIRLADAIDATQTQKLEDWEVKLRWDQFIIEGHCREDYRMERWSLTEKARLFERYFNVKVQLRVEENTF